MYLTDRQIKWMCIIFPISAFIGPVGAVINVLIYLVIAMCIYTGLGGVI